MEPPALMRSMGTLVLVMMAGQEYTVKLVSKAARNTRFIIIETGFTCTKCFLHISDIDECLSGACLNGATCTDEVNGYTCTCDDGWTGVHCETGILINEYFVF